MSRFNAMKSGVYAGDYVLPGESHEAYNELRTQIFEEHAPEGAIEVALCQQIVQRLRRFERLDHADHAAHTRTILTLQRKEYEFKRDGGLHSGGNIDLALNLSLREESEKLRNESAEATPLEPTNDVTDSTAAQTPEVPTPSAAMTFFKSYAWSETNKPCLEIDRQKRGAYKELLELFAALDAMQAKRRAREEKPGQKLTDPEPVLADSVV